MNTLLRTAWRHEWDLATAARARGDLGAAFAHLERAHILGQRDTLAHARSHVAMLVIGWQRRDRREVVGQLARIVAALLFSRLWVPAGNTGGANVGALRPMPVPEDLRALLARAAGGGIA